MLYIPILLLTCKLTSHNNYYAGILVTVVVGVGCAGLVVGAGLVCSLLVMYKLFKRRQSLRKQEIEVENNVAYETVNFRTVKGGAKNFMYTT